MFVSGVNWCGKFGWGGSSLKVMEFFVFWKMKVSEAKSYLLCEKNRIVIQKE